MSLRKHAAIAALLVALPTSSALVACSDDETTTSTPTPAPTSTGTTPAPTATTEPPATLKDIVDTAAANGSFKTLVAAVQAAGLVETLKSPGPFTVFAPTDTAFGKLDPALVTKLTSAPYKTVLGNILKHHVLAGEVKAAAVLGKTTDAKTVLGSGLKIEGANSKVVIGGVTVIQADVATKNGVIHGIDGVLLPTIVETAVAYDDGTTKFKTLVAAVTAADLAATLSGPGPFTVFAPSDAAFAKLPAGTLTNLLLPANKAQLAAILKYHVVSGAVFEKNVAAGDVTTVNGAKFNISIVQGKPVITGGSVDNKSNIVFTDIPNVNGVIHVIDTVILPPAT